MLCYKDITFCSFYASCIHGKECEMALTDIVIDKAEKINLPICQFVEIPDCHIIKK